MNLLQYDKLEALINTLRPMFDYIVLDTPPCAMMADALAMCRHVDRVIYVIREDFAATTQIFEGIQALRRQRPGLLLRLWLRLWVWLRLWLWLRQDQAQKRRIRIFPSLRPRPGASACQKRLFRQSQALENLYKPGFLWYTVLSGMSEFTESSGKSRPGRYNKEKHQRYSQVGGKAHGTQHSGGRGRPQYLRPDPHVPGKRGVRRPHRLRRRQGRGGI